jgi:protein-S-isoprenylcysteine O-methyltransferase Ste14
LTNQKINKDKHMLKKATRWVLFTLIFCGGVLALSGDWTSWLLWSYLAGVSAVFFYALISLDPDLAKERFHPPVPGADASALRWVRATALATLVIAPLDLRFHWSMPIPDAVRTAAIAGSLAAFAFCFRAMLTNRFFSSVIRIQDDRGHRVVDHGPYAVIRHPGYAGMIAGVPLMAIALGSWWALAVASLYALLILNRVVVEDRFLQVNLPGYVEYSTRVTSRLLPGIW